MTTDGTYQLETITLEQAKQLAAEASAGPGLDSAIGHQATAEHNCTRERPRPSPEELGLQLFKP